MTASNSCRNRSNASTATCFKELVHVVKILTAALEKVNATLARFFAVTKDQDAVSTYFHKHAFERGAAYRIHKLENCSFRDGIRQSEAGTGRQSFKGGAVTAQSLVHYRSSKRSQDVECMSASRILKVPLDSTF